MSNQCTVIGLGMFCTIIKIGDNDEILFLSSGSTKEDITWTRYFAGAYMMNGFDRTERHATSLGLATYTPPIEIRQLADRIAFNLRVARNVVQEMFDQKTTPAPPSHRILEL